MTPAKKLERLRDAALAYKELATCYRIGKRPTEKLFDRLDKADAALAEIEEDTNG